MIILLIGIFITDIFKYGIWFVGIKGFEIRHSKLAGIITGFNILLILAGIINKDTLLILWNIIDVIILGISINCNRGERSLAILQAFFIVTCTDEIIGGLIQLFSGISNPNSLVNKYSYLINNIIVIFILFTLSILKKKFKILKKLKLNNLHRGIVFVLSACMCAAMSLTVAGFQHVVRYISNRKVSIFLGFISIISFMCIVYLVMIISYIFNENKRYREYLEKDALLMETQKNMYEVMMAKNEETRRFRHDISNHFMCLNELACSGQLEKVQNYLKGISGNFNAITNKAYTVGNSVIDAALNYYLSMLETEVSVEIRGCCVPKLEIDDVDLCTVFSNLIQNAVEALNKQTDTEKYIEIEFLNRKGYSQIKITNSITPEDIKINEKNKLPETTKRNKSEHGIGIRNAKDTVERNRGVINVEIIEDKFVAVFILPMSNR